MYGHDLHLLEHCALLSFILFACSTMYWDDRYGTETVSHEVLGRMKQLMVDNNTAASHSFLLDDDSSIPFSLDDISNLMEDKVNQSLAVLAFLKVTLIHYVCVNVTIIHCILTLMFVCLHELHIWMGLLLHILWLTWPFALLPHAV